MATTGFEANVIFREVIWQKGQMVGKTIGVIAPYLNRPGLDALQCSAGQHWGSHSLQRANIFNQPIFNIDVVFGTVVLWWSW